MWPHRTDSREGTYDHYEGTPSHRPRSSRSSWRYSHRTRGGGSALPGGVWPPEVSVPPHGPSVHAGLQAGLPRERRADGAGHMRARMHDHVPVRQDRLPVGSRHVPGQLPAGLATAWAAAERLPRQLRPGSGGVREGRGGASEDLRCRLPHDIGPAGLPQGVHRCGQAGWCDVRGWLPDLPRELPEFAQRGVRKLNRKLPPGSGSSASADLPHCMSSAGAVPAWVRRCRRASAPHTRPALARGRIRRRRSAGPRVRAHALRAAPELVP